MARKCWGRINQLSHVYLHQADVELATATAERQARLFSPATKLLGQICKAQVFPDLANARKRESYQVNVLTALGLEKTQGLPRRPLLLVPNAVHRVLFSAASEAKLQKENHKHSFVPDFSCLPKPLWTPFTRKRLRGKQAADLTVPQPSKRRTVKSLKSAFKCVSWTHEEATELDAARDRHHKERIQNIILHNRTATAFGRHSLECFDVDTDLRCEICQKTTALANLSKFRAESWGGIADRDTVYGPKQMRRTAKIAQRVSWAEVHNASADMSGKHLLKVPVSVDTPLQCVREGCQASCNEGWRRFGKFSKNFCLSAPNTD